MTGAIRFITVPIMHQSAQAFRFHKGKSDVTEKSNHRMSKKMFIFMLVRHVIERGGAHDYALHVITFFHVSAGRARKRTIPQTCAL